MIRRSSRQTTNPQSLPMPSSLTYTDNRQYAIHQGSTRRGEAGSLYAQQSPQRAPSPYGQPSRSPSRYATESGESFRRYQYERSYPDCLGYAEEIMHGGSARPPGHVSSRESVSGRPLGESHTQNRNIALNARANNPLGPGYQYANPQVGEAYGVIPTTRPGQRAVPNPYHFAPVVARDQFQTITAEQDAGMRSRTDRRDTLPTMDMYQPGHPQRSFEGRYATDDMYGSTAPVVVAQPYGLSTEQLRALEQSRRR